MKAAIIKGAGVMKITLINGYNEKRNLGFLSSIKDTLIEAYTKQGHEISYYNLLEKDAQICERCQNCFIKTPGQCVIDDDVNTIAQAYIYSDLVFWMTPVVFGGYSIKIKRVMERLLPLLLPSIEKEKGFYCYKRRYEKYPNNVVIGILPEANKNEESILFDLLEKNTKRIGGKNNICALLYEHQCDSEIKEVLECLMEDLERAGV